MLSFISLKNHSVTIGINFSLDFMSDIISSNTIKAALFFVGLSSSKSSQTIVCG